MEYAEDETSSARRMREFISDNFGILLITVFIAASLGVLGVVILDSVYHRDSQSVYSDNANVVLQGCMRNLDYDDPGDIIDCLYDAGFTLTYNGEPVRRITNDTTH